MPIREYQCFVDGEKCEQAEPLLQCVDAVPFCPKCGNRMVWAPSTPASFILKGQGWTPKGK